MITTKVILSSVLLLVNGLSTVHGFSLRTANLMGVQYCFSRGPSFSASSSRTHHPVVSYTTTTSRMLLKKGGNSSINNNSSDDDDDVMKSSAAMEGDDDTTLVTREMLHRDLLEDPQVKRKRRKNGGYKPLDNRDHLPFAVRKITPDPYTRPEVKKAKQKKDGNKRKTPTDLDYHLSSSSSSSSSSSKRKSTASTTSSRLYQSTNDGMDTSTLLGEFQLDKSTTSGDVIVLGEKEYQVQSARCQYKYAGGQRFVMVRKILEVKEVTRVVKEEALMRTYTSSPSSRSADQPPQLE